MEWVEIREPASGKPLFVHQPTGRSVWSLSSDTPFVPYHEDQWWELADAGSGKVYYFNYARQETQWECPSDNVVSLAKLQSVSETRAEDQEAQEIQPYEPEPESEPGPISRVSSVPAVGAAAAAAATSSVPSQRASESHLNRTSLQPPASGSPFSATAPAASASAPPPAPALPQYTTPLFPAGTVVKQPVPPGFEDLSNYKSNFAKHKKGIFRKRVSIGTMLSWSKQAISAPMLQTPDKKIKKDALELFKLVQIYMGDRRAGDRTPLAVATELVDRAWATPALRDELFLQLCKQTTLNRNLPSLIAGWDLICICLCFFPPSTKFYHYLNGYISKFTEEANIEHHAQLATKWLERVHKNGAKKGTVPPIPEEVDFAKSSILRTPVFGSPLEDVMELQHKNFPHLRVPRVLQLLCAAILAQNGHRTEGIFRVPGDIDAINLLKITLNKGEMMVIHDPHVPGSALKLWFRDLPDPVIGAEFYDACVNSCDDGARAIAIMNQLPQINREVLLFIVRFLQTMGKPENQPFTKMTMDNLAMVWAPNFLRCPSEDPMVIFNNTRREMLFVRQLISTWDTSAAESM